MFRSDTESVRWYMGGIRWYVTDGVLPRGDQWHINGRRTVVRVLFRVDVGTRSDVLAEQANANLPAAVLDHSAIVMLTKHAALNVVAAVGVLAISVASVVSKMGDDFVVLDD